MRTFQTTDLCDAHGEAVRVAEPILKSFGGRKRFFGRIATLRLHDDNGLVRKRLDEAGAGRVLVVDGGGSLRCALLGDQLAALALANDWAGVVVHGCIRDSQAIGQMPLGVLALAPHPRKTVKNNLGDIDVPVHFAGIDFLPGEWLYADEDGLIVSRDALVAP